jgi:hypothetical protein
MVCCRLYPFICWIIIKEGPRNFSGGRSPHWVNHVYLCLYCIVYLLCFISICFILLLCDLQETKRYSNTQFLLKTEIFRDCKRKYIVK